MSSKLEFELKPKYEKEYMIEMCKYVIYLGVGLLLSSIILVVIRNGINAFKISEILEFLTVFILFGILAVIYNIYYKKKLDKIKYEVYNDKIIIINGDKKEEIGYEKIISITVESNVPQEKFFLGNIIITMQNKDAYSLKNIYNPNSVLNKTKKIIMKFKNKKN